MLKESLFSYLIGSVPTAFLLGKIFKIDLFKVGSNSPGTSNAYRVGGFKFGIVVLMCDLLKGYLSVKLFDQNNQFIALFFSCLGHIFPIWTNFKGGKGVACLVGGMLAIDPVLGMILGLSWLILAKFLKIATIASFFVLSVFLIFYFNMVSILLFLLIIFKHTDNIKRIIQGKENLLK